MSANKQPSRVTPLEHTLIGAVGGVMEVCLMQPMVAFKNALQEGRPLPTTPIQMYRGLLVSRAAYKHTAVTRYADQGCVWQSSTLCRVTHTCSWLQMYAGLRFVAPCWG